jgi:hypothetical protein
MLMLQPAKRIILLLISLNVVTILALVVTFSFGMPIVNARLATCSPIGSVSSNTITTIDLSSPVTYTGHLYTSDSPPEIAGDIKFVFASQSSNTPYQLSETSTFTSTHTKIATSQVSILQVFLSSGTVDSSIGSDMLNSFGVVANDLSGNQVTVYFIGGSGTAHQFGGAWFMKDGKYDGFFGKWLVTRQSTSSVS